MRMHAVMAGLCCVVFTFSRAQVGDPCICRLSRVLERCKGIERLDLSSNQLSVLPASLEALTQLRQLDLSSNQLRQLPDFLTKMQSLEVSNSDRLMPCNRSESLLTYIDKLKFLMLKVGCAQLLNVTDNPLTSGIEVHAGTKVVQ